MSLVSACHVCIVVVRWFFFSTDRVVGDALFRRLCFSSHDKRSTVAELTADRSRTQLGRVIPCMCGHVRTEHKSLPVLPLSCGLLRTKRKPYQAFLAQLSTREAQGIIQFASSPQAPRLANTRMDPEARKVQNIAAREPRVPSI